jgi:hypothetical protein
MSWCFSFGGDYRGHDIGHSDTPELQVNSDAPGEGQAMSQVRAARNLR